MKMRGACVLLRCILVRTGTPWEVRNSRKFGKLEQIVNSRRVARAMALASVPKLEQRPDDAAMYAGATWFI